MSRVLAVLGGATLGFLIYGVAADSPSVAYYVPITVVLALVIGLIHSSVGFSMPVLWGLTAVAIGNMAGGVILIEGAPLYELHVLGSVQYDKLFHAFAAGVGAWAALEALRHWGMACGPGLVLVAVMVASGAGAFVEIVEYFGSLLIENDSVGGYTNTMQDLIANTLGAVVGATLAYRLTGTESVGPG